METSNLQKLVYAYCAGHAGVSGNERADCLASRALIIGALKMGISDILRSITDN